MPKKPHVKKNKNSASNSKTAQQTTSTQKEKRPLPSDSGGIAFSETKEENRIERVNKEE